MADLFLDSRLPDYFREYDWRQVEVDDGERDALLTGYASEQVSLLHGLDMSAVDFAFLRTISLPQTWAMKKLDSDGLVDRGGRAVDSELARSVRDQGFGGDTATMDRFVEQLAIVRSIATTAIRRILDGKAYPGIKFVFRFSETRMENLHFDTDKGCDDHEAFRFYINLDSSPRIWATSYQITDLMEQGGRRLLDGIDVEAPSLMIQKHLTRGAFGGWNQRATERIAPHHNIFFDPGDVWIIDGRSVSHQVQTGHRVLSAYVALSKDALPAGTRTYREKLLAGHEAGMRRARGEETATVNYFGRLPAVADIRENWGEVFGEIGSGRLRRFDDQGLQAVD